MKRVLTDGYKFSFGKNQPVSTPKFTSIEITSGEMARMKSQEQLPVASSSVQKQNKIKSKFKPKISDRHFFNRKIEKSSSFYENMTEINLTSYDVLPYENKKNSKSIGFIRGQLKQKTLIEQTEEENPLKFSLNNLKNYKSAPSTPKNNREFMSLFSKKQQTSSRGLQMLKNKTLCYSASNLEKKSESRNSSYLQIYRKQKQKKQSLQTLLSMMKPDPPTKLESMKSHQIKSGQKTSKWKIHNNTHYQFSKLSSTNRDPQIKQIEKLRKHFGMKIQNSKKLVSKNIGSNLEERIKNLNATSKYKQL